VPGVLSPGHHVAMNGSRIVGSNVAVQAAVRQHYHQPRNSSVIRPPIVIATAPAFALIVPTEYVVHLAPESGLHPQATAADQITGSTEVVLVFVVFLVVAGKVLVRFRRR
jgi:hypothetical protein